MTNNEIKHYLIDYIRLTCEDKIRLKIDPAVCFRKDIKAKDMKLRNQMLDELVLENKIKFHKSASHYDSYTITKI